MVMVIVEGEEAVLGVNLLRSCEEVYAAIKLSLGDTSEVGHRMGVVDGVHVPQAEGWFGGFGIPIQLVSLNGMFLCAMSKF